MPIFINEPFVGGRDPFEIFQQGIQTLNVMGTSRQQWVMCNHAELRDPQTQLEAIVVQIFGGTLSKISFGLETMVSHSSGYDAGWQRKGINHLDRVIELSTHHHQPLLNGRFDLP